MRNKLPVYIENRELPENEFITDNNIQPEAVFELVEKVKTMDLSDENNTQKCNAAARVRI